MIFVNIPMPLRPIPVGLTRRSTWLWYFGAETKKVHRELSYELASAFCFKPHTSHCLFEAFDRFWHMKSCDASRDQRNWFFKPDVFIQHFWWKRVTVPNFFQPWFPLFTVLKTLSGRRFEIIVWDAENLQSYIQISKPEGGAVPTVH